VELLYLFFIGLSVGFVSSFFGIGGGSIMIPLLYIIFPKLPPQAIIATSLGTIFLSSGLNSFRYKKILPPPRIISAILIASSIGAILGSQMLYSIPAPLIKKLFGVILFIATIKVFVSPKAVDHKLLKIHDFKVFNTCLFGSILSSITGLGGGIIFVPLFMNLVKLPLRLISAYSNLAMMVTTFMGVLPHFFKEINYSNPWPVIDQSFIGHVSPILIGSLFSGAFIASKWGIKFNSTVSDKAKKYSLGIILLILSIKIILF